MRPLLAMAALLLATPVAAQEVLVSAQRRGYTQGDPTYSNGVVASSRPIINLRRTADYAVASVRVAGDARDMATRRADLRATVRAMIARAGGAGVELATGDYVLERLTADRVEELPLSGDGRPDTDVTGFLVKVRLTAGMTIEGAKAQIDRFVAATPRTGRTQVTVLGGPTLSVVNPDQYRAQIIALIAADAAATTALFGPRYGVDVAGLDRPVEWARAGPTEVFLFLPAAYTVRRD